jgi:hypothetical protein
MLFSLGWRGMVFIVDDNFIGNKRNVKKFLPELAAWSERHGQPFAFLTEASVNLAEDEELLEGMRRANFRRVFLGIETPVEASLIEAQKEQNTRGDLLASVREDSELWHGGDGRLHCRLRQRPGRHLHPANRIHSRQAPYRWRWSAYFTRCLRRSCGAGSNARGACWLRAPATTPTVR